MRYWGRTIATAALLGVLGCAGRGAILEQQQLSLQPISGTTPNEIEARQVGDSIVLQITELDSDGTFVQLELPEGKTVSNEEWRGDESVLHLVVPVGGVAEIGVVPLSTYSGQAVNAKLSLGPASKSVQTPPQGARGEVTDLTVSYSREGYVTLQWTEVNNGDYDLNGEVSVSDLTPLGVHFMETYDASAPDAHLNPLYWIDGDRNGEINQADITRIGANYKSTIGGYTVLRDGLVTPDPMAFLPTCRRDSEHYVTLRAGLPPFYTIELVGFIDEPWQVVPVDRDFREGPDPGTNLSDASLVDLSGDVEVSGAPLLDLRTANMSGVSGSYEILRIIEPSEIVNSYEIGERLALEAQGTPYFFDSSEGRFVEVPREQAMLLEVIYVPAVDLATGVAKSGPVTADDIVITAIPFRLPKSNESVSPPVADIDAQIELEEKPGGGYYVIVHMVLTTYDTNNHHDNVTESTTRLDYATGVLSRLSEPGGDYDFEAELTDEDRDGISESHLEELLQFDIYSVYWNIGVKITGTIAAYDEGAGVIQLDDAVQTAGNFDLGDIEVRFAELTQFGEIDPEGDWQSPDPVDPSDLQVGDELVLGVYIYDDEPPVYWALTVVRQL